jgi:hypothetical protein
MISRFSIITFDVRKMRLETCMQLRLRVINGMYVIATTAVNEGTHNQLDNLVHA